MLKSFVVIFVLFLAIPATATEFSVSLPGRDDYVLTVPDSWIVQTRRPRADLPPTVAVTSKEGDAIRALITPIWPIGNAKTPTQDLVRSLVEGAAKEAQPRAVERSLPLQRITGPSTNGYYFSATDRQPGMGGYKYQTQGMIVLDELSIMFTILHNDGTQKLAKQGLEMLRTAHRVSAQASSPRLGACASKMHAAQDAYDAAGTRFNEAEASADKAKFADPTLNDAAISALNDYLEAIAARSIAETDCQISP